MSGPTAIATPAWLRIVLANETTVVLANEVGIVLLEEEYPGASGLTRVGVAEKLLDSMNRGDSPNLNSPILSGHGTFTAIIVCLRSQRVAGLTDSLGISPLFVDRRRTSTTVVSTSFGELDVLFATDADLAGVVQKALLGFQLSRRTHLRNVSRMRSGESLLFDRRSNSIYFTEYGFVSPLRSIETSDTWPSEASRVFSAAVTERLRAVNLESHVSYLSGGLDSRVTIAEVAKSAKVSAVSHSRRGTREFEYSRLLAEALGLPYYVSTPPPDRVTDWAELMRTQLVALSIPQPHYVWSGDGGSVTCGTVYCTDPLVEAFTRSPEEVAEFLLLEFGVGVPFVLKASSPWCEAVSVTKEDLVSEIARAKRVCADRAAHLFFMLCDQHRHLDLYFERRAMHGVRFLLPFFDRRVVDFWLSIPLRPRLYHRLYMRWFDTFDQIIRSTPWQTYPGHVPCPVPTESPLLEQWSKSYWPERTMNVRRALRKGTWAAIANGCQQDALSRIGLLVSLMLDVSGVRSQPAALSLGMELADLGRNRF